MKEFNIENAKKGDLILFHSEAYHYNMLSNKYGSWIADEEDDTRTSRMSILKTVNFICNLDIVSKGRDNIQTLIYISNYRYPISAVRINCII